MKLYLKVFIGSFIGFVFVISVGFIFFPKIIKSIFDSQKALKEGNLMYEYYKKLPFSIDFCIYFFNVTNPLEVQNQGSKPILKEVGPYCYDSYKSKVNIEINENEDTLTYTPLETFFYNDNKTHPRSHDDYVTIVHPIMMAALNTVNVTVPSFLKLLNKALDPIFSNPQSIYLTAKVRDILFDGIELNCSGTDSYSTLICSQVKTKVPGVIVRDDGILLISLFGPRNGTLQHRIKVNRGVSKAKDVAKVLELNNQTKQTVWSGEECNRIAGCDGWVYQSYLDSVDVIEVFSVDLCRIIRMKYASQTVYENNNVRQYSFVFGDIESTPDEQCFCDPPTTCFRKGVMNLRKCLGLPVYASLPHFLEADESYLSGVQGLSPDYSSHVTEISFQPLLGVPLEFRKRMQLSFLIGPLMDVPLTAKLPEVLHPFMWMEEGLGVTGPILKQVTVKLLLLKIVKGFMWFALIASIGGLATAGYLRYKKQNIVQISNKTNASDNSNKSYINRVINSNEPEKF